MTSQLTIIAATDYSQTASNAVVYAAGFAAAAGAKLVLFNAFSISVHTANAMISAYEMNKQLEKASARINTLSREIAEAFKIEVSSYCSYSFLEDELLSVIDAAGADLLVMGMAENSFEQDLLGNSTTSVIRNIAFPVLAVPQSAQFQNLKKILYACDALSWGTVKNLGWIAKLIENLGTEIEFFSVDGSVAELKERNKGNLDMEKEIQGEKHVYKKVRSKDVIAELKKEIIEYSPDILVMVPRQYGFWDSLVHTSKTRVMASGLEIPLLSFPNF